MEKILICPGDRPAVAFLAQSVPLVTMPLLGENLLSYWLESLANSGARDVLILATDRPELVRAVVNDGSRWGLRARVEAELKELTPEAACARLAEGPTTVPVSERDVIVLDHLPGESERRLFQSYRHWYEAVLSWIPRPAELNRIGLREVKPQIWCGQRTRVAPSARLEPPCWLGDHVQVGPDAVVGPNAILENRVAVDGASEIRSSIVGPDTFVGALIKLENSIAWGSTLIDWRTGSCTQVPDPFLLCALGQRYLPDGSRSPLGWWRRLWSRLTAAPGKLGPA